MEKLITEKKIAKTQQGDFHANFKQYFAEAGEGDLFTLFASQRDQITAIFESIDEEKSMHRYAENKWTIKELVQHLIDTERIFSYRSLAFARHDPATLSSFDENLYADMSNANDRSWKEIAEEFFVARRSAEMMYNSFSEDAMSAVGKASDYTVGVATLAFVTIGHVNHHLTILRQRYLS